MVDLEKISRNLGLSEEFLSEKIKEKIDQADGLIDEETALLLVLKEFGIDITDLSRTKLIDIFDQNMVSNLYVVVDDILTKKDKIVVLSIYDDTAKAKLILKNNALDLLRDIENNKIIHIKKAVILYNNKIALYINNKNLIDFDIPEKVLEKLKRVDKNKIHDIRVVEGKILEVENNYLKILTKNLKILKFLNTVVDISRKTYKLKILGNYVKDVKEISEGDIYRLVKKLNIE